ncbi:MAG: Spi family protease inhibitor [Bacteroidia bacterium]
MIKKLTLSVLTFVIGSSICLATNIGSDEAKKVAETFYSLNSNKVINKLSLTYTHQSNTGETLYYVFNVNENDGYVIIPANDAQPVMGYATQGTYTKPQYMAENSIVINKWSASGWAVTPKTNKS